MGISFTGIEIIVFDLDDTLFPEQQFVESGFHAVSAWLKHSGITRVDVFPEMWRLFCDGSRGSIFNDVLTDSGIEPEKKIIEKLVGVYRSHKPVASCYPDAMFVLEYLYGKKKLGLLSDGFLQSQKNKLHALGIEHFFDTIVFTDEIGRQFWKPHPAGYKKIMGKFSFSGNQCIYIGDNPKKDFSGARQLGWKTVQIKRTDGIYKNEKNSDACLQADITFKDLYQLTEIIE
jgi:putative hydrolase of the HAD superfamily